MKKKVAIVGGGFAGLACSIYLATKGFDVYLFEKNNLTGGKASQIKENGFRFDTGPTLITMPFIIDELFKSTNENMNDYINLKLKDILCKYFYNDGSYLLQYSNQEKFLNELIRFSENSNKHFADYLFYSKNIYDFSSRFFLFSTFKFHDIFTRFSIKDIFKIHLLDPFRTVHQANSYFFRDKRLIQLFDRYATYTGSNPYKAPATFNIIPFVEYHFGGYSIEGGIFKLVDSLSTLAKKCGVHIYTNSEVNEIITKNKSVKGLRVNGEIFYSDIVVSNADLIFTYQNLLRDLNSVELKRYLKQEKSTSAFIFYFGVDGIHKDVEMDNILFSCDYKNEFDDLFSRKIIPQDPTIHIHISSKLNSTDAPENNENWYVMINAPSVTKMSFDVEGIKNNILSKIKSMTGIDLRNKIKFEKVITPDDIKNITSAYDGSLYGPSSNNKLSAFMRQKNKSNVYDNLYFCGGTVHPGGGIPLAILSGKITSELINKYEK